VELLLQKSDIKEISKYTCVLIYILELLSFRLISYQDAKNLFHIYAGSNCSSLYKVQIKLEEKVMKWGFF